MNIYISETVAKQAKKFSPDVQKKFKKQLVYLQNDFRHPSLRARKKSGSDSFEARIDYHYRFTYHINEDTIFIESVGPHDEGLGKK